MGFPTSEIVGLIYKLLPGFVAAWIFYSLTAHPRKGPFERTVQALIFTGITHFIVFLIGKTCLAIGRNWRELGKWDDDASFAVSVVVALILGLTFASLANTNWIHGKLPKRISKRTSFPSEWYSAFYGKERFVYLHLKGRRRLYGWPTEWPDHPRTGHFVLEKPEWILDDNSHIPLLLTEKMLIRASDVVMVEFEKPESEWNFDREQQKKYEETLVNLNKAEMEKKSDATETTGAKPEEGALCSGGRDTPVFPERASPATNDKPVCQESTDFTPASTTQNEIKETKHGS